MRHVSQDPGEPRRRWFSDEEFDLIVWMNADESIHGFELCYDKQGREKALRWIDGQGIRHYAVDSGEQSPEHNRSPMLQAMNGRGEMKRVLESFRSSREELPDGLSDLVQKKLAEYGEF